MLSAQDKLDAAARHEREDRLDDALVLYQLVLDVNPQNSKALTAVAGIEARMGRMEAALEAAGAAVALRPDDIEALKLLADLSGASGNRSRQAALHEQIVALDPEGASTALLRAERAANTGELGECERILVDALRVKPDEVPLMLALSRLYFTLGMTSDSLALSHKAVQQAPSDLVALKQLAEQLDILGDRRSALQWRQKSLLARPSDVSVMAQLADAHGKCGELSEARRLIDRALALSPDALFVWEVAIRIAVLEGEAASTLRRFSDIARRHADRIGAALCLVQGYRACGQYDTAVRLLASLNQSAKLTDEQRHVVNAIARELRFATGAFLRADNDDGNAASAFLDPITPPIITISAATPVMEMLPLIRVCRARHDHRPIAVAGPETLTDLFALMPAIDFEAHAGVPPPDAPGFGQLAELAMARPDLIACNEPYIQPPVDAVRRWRTALSALPRPWIALSWNEERPGMLLTDLVPLVSGQAGSLIAVVWDESRHQLSDYPDIIDAGVHINGLGDLAALLFSCDAVIGPDSLPLHLAGALGRPGAVLTQPGAPWYWLHRQQRSVWYPTLQVLAAQETGHWARRRDDLRPGLTAFLEELQVSVVEATGAVPAPTEEEITLT